MVDKQIKKENFLIQHRNEIIVGVLITVIGSVAYALISGIGTTIYSRLLGNKKVEVSQLYTPTATTSQSLIINPQIQGYELADFSTTTINVLLDKIRNEHKVRQLLSLESGKKLADVPELTYSFLYPAYLRILPYESHSVILKGKTDRFNVFYGGYFEIHKISNDEIYLLGFVSEETYLNIKGESKYPPQTSYSKTSDRFQVKKQVWE